MPPIPEQAMTAFWTIMMSGLACMLMLLVSVIALVVFSTIVDTFIIKPEAERKAREARDYDD